MIDKYDNLISVSSGVLTSIIDSMFISPLSYDFNFIHDNGRDIIDDFVMKLSGEDNITSAVKHFEKIAPIPSDPLESDFGGTNYHHLYDFAHHPTPMGMFFSILTQFTGYAFGTNNMGVFKAVKIDGFNRSGFPNAIYEGTFKWFLHMISDVAGSSSTAATTGGTGLPGPMLSLLKEISAIPGIRAMAGKDKDGNYVFSETCQGLFNGTILGTRFDLRTELGLAYEPVRTKQYIPVLLSECIVCAFYSITRFAREINEKNISSVSDLKYLDFTKFLPWKSAELKRMRTISAVSFSTVDISTAAIVAYSVSGGDKKTFAVEFAKRVNYFGVGRLIVAGTGEIGMKLEKTYDEYGPIVERLTKETIPVNGDVKDVAEKGASSYFAIAGMGTPVGFVAAAIGVFKEIKTSSDEYKAAREERIRIEQECDVAIQMLQEYRDEMELVVSEYMVEHLTVFGEGLDMMDSALESDDTDKFIQGNNMIQKELGRDSSFSSQDEFDGLMLSDGDFKL